MTEKKLDTLFDKLLKNKNNQQISNEIISDIIKRILDHFTKLSLFLKNNYIKNSDAGLELRKSFINNNKYYDYLSNKGIKLYIESVPQFFDSIINQLINIPELTIFVSRFLNVKLTTYLIGSKTNQVSNINIDFKNNFIFHLEKYLNNNNEKEDVLKECASYFSLFEDFNNELKVRTQIINLFPTKDNYLKRANLYLNSNLDNNMNLAKIDIDKGIELDNNCFISYGLRGKLKYKSKDYTSALNDFNLAIKLAGDNGNIGEILGEKAELCYRHLNFYDEAILTYNKKIEKYYEINDYYFRGYAHYLFKNYKLAIKDLNKTIEDSPNDESAYGLLGECYMNLHDYENSYKYYKIANELGQEGGAIMYSVEQEHAGDAYIHQLKNDNINKYDDEYIKLKEYETNYQNYKIANKLSWENNEGILYYSEQEKAADSFIKTNNNFLKKMRENETILKEKDKSQNETVSMYIHNITPKIGILKNNLNLINKFISKNGLLEKPVNSINPKLIGKLIIESESILKDFSTQITRTGNFTRLTKDSLKLKELKFIKFIKKNIIKYIDEKYTSFNIKSSITSKFNEKDDISVILDEKYIEDVFINLVDNSVKHGFEKKNNNHININIAIIIKNHKEFLKIDFNNNGFPFPIGFGINQFVQFQKRGNSEKEGSGIGGAFIKKIIKFHNGELNLHQSKIGVHFEILLPLKQEKGNGEK